MSQPVPQPNQSIVIAGVEIPPAEQTPLVMALLGVIQRLERENAELREEIQRMKGSTQRPKIQPSRWHKPPVAPPTKRTLPLVRRSSTESWYENLGLVSDDALQFKVFGFIHEQRTAVAVGKTRGIPGRSGTSPPSAAQQSG